MKPIEVFISYHEKDEELRQELEAHLAALRREQVISNWHDRKIIPGQDIKGEIDQRLNQAGLILLLISPDFLNSDYHWTVEVTRALQQNAAKKACVIPVLLRHVDLGTGRLTELLPLPKNRQPIKSWVDRDEAFLEVVKGIREAIAPLIEQLNNNSNDSTHQETTKVEEDLQYQVTSLLNEADRLYDSKKFEEAVLKYKAALSLDPNSLYAYNNLGLALYDQGKLEAAIASFHQALKINPNYANAHSNLGVVLYNQGKLEAAIASFQQALSIDSNFAIAHYNLGLVLDDQGKLEAAITSYRRALKINPNYAKAYNNLGNVLKAQGKLEAAITSYRQALSIDPNYANAHYNLGVVLYNQGKLEQAIASYRQALSIDPNYANAHYNLGLALDDQGKLEDAIASYRQALRINPNYAKAHNIPLAKVLLSFLSFASLRLCVSFSVILSATPKYLCKKSNNLGIALKAQGKLEAAIAELEIAVSLDPTSTLYRKNLELYQNEKKGFWGRLFGG